MASDALWLGSFLTTHFKGYQEGCFDMKEGKDLKVLEKRDKKAIF